MQNATSGERFVTNYTNDVGERGEAYTYEATAEVSRKLLHLHFSAGKSYTYSYAFEGLLPGHAYSFTGLVSSPSSLPRCSAACPKTTSGILYNFILLSAKTYNP